MERTLIVVHPGSVCGSADFNLGGVKAAQAREKLSNTLFSWKGDVLVIDGELSRELDYYPLPSLAIKNKSDTGKVKRTIACSLNDENWVEKACGFISKNVTQETPVLLTGAWHEQNGESGCINAIEKILNDMGYKTTISDCAFVL
jgi:hypothetical protein